MHNDSSRRGARLGESAAFGDVGFGGGRSVTPSLVTEVCERTEIC
jgi:hypothetical protein